MTSEFKFLEGRLRNQLPELADAYGAPTVPTTGLGSNSAPGKPTAVMAGDFPLADELSPTDDAAVRHLETGRRAKQARISRIGLVTAVAGLLVVVGVLATAVGTRESVTSADPAVGQTDDQAETDVDGAFAVNAMAVRHLAAASARHGARLCHVSTDYVFDGTSDRPYVEWDHTCGRSVYGRSKEAGEREAGPEAVIVRTSWV